jgi:cyclopropane fatty-acyl-phospholipid synthase-like methyltransferase
MKPNTPEEVTELIDAVFVAAAVGAAMELGLFWLLAGRPLEATAVARELDIPERRCRAWLDLLCNTDLVERVDGGYGTSETGRRTILESYSQESWAFLARETRVRLPAVVDLPTRIHEQGSVWASQGITPPDYFHNLQERPERARTFTRMLYEIHQQLAALLAVSLDLSGVQRLMDIGGGSGVISMALLREQPGLSAMVVDIANVCAVGRELAAENGLEDRLVFHASDFYRDTLPTGFDMILECDVGAYGVEFFKKLRGALNPGGRLAIVDKFVSGELRAPVSRRHWAFLGSLENPDSTALDAAGLKRQLTEASFRILSHDNLPSDEYSRWSSEWEVIVAKLEDNDEPND